MLLAMFGTAAGHAQKFQNVGYEPGSVATKYIDGLLWVFTGSDSEEVEHTCYFSSDSYGRYFQIGLGVWNLGDESFVFDPAEVEATITFRGVEEPVKVYTIEEFRKKIERSKILTAVAYGLNSFSAGMSAANNDVSGTVLATSQMHSNERLMDKISAEQEAKSVGYLKINTIDPGEGINGYINLRRRRGEQLTIRIPVNGHTYIYRWDVSQERSRRRRAR